MVFASDPPPSPSINPAPLPSPISGTTTVQEGTNKTTFKIKDDVPLHFYANDAVTVTFVPDVGSAINGKFITVTRGSTYTKKYSMTEIVSGSSHVWQLKLTSPSQTGQYSVAVQTIRTDNTSEDKSFVLIIDPKPTTQATTTEASPTQTTSSTPSPTSSTTAPLVSPTSTESTFETLIPPTSDTPALQNLPTPSQLPSPSTPSLAPTKAGLIRSITKPLTAPIVSGATSLQPVISNPSIQTTAATADTLAAAVVATGSALPAAANLPLLNTLGQLSGWLAGLSTRRKRKPWGRVFDTESNQQVAGAIVRIMQADTNKVLETQVTDRIGAFGFLVPPGQYVLRVIKGHYLFPAHTVKDGYHGAIIHITNEDIVDLNIPIDPEISTLARRLFFVTNLDSSLRAFHLPLLVLGTALGLVFAFGYPSVLNLAILAAYGLAWVIEVIGYIRKPRSSGAVHDEQTKTGLDLAIVRLFETHSNRLVATKVTDHSGRFLLLAQPGDYHLNIVRPGYSQLAQQPWSVRGDAVLARDFYLSTQPSTTTIPTPPAGDPLFTMPSQPAPQPTPKPKPAPLVTSESVQLPTGSSIPNIGAVSSNAPVDLTAQTDRPIL